MIVAIIVVGIIALGLFVLAMKQQKRIAEMSALEGRFEAKDAQLQGKDELLRQKDMMLAERDRLLEQSRIEASKRESAYAEAQAKAEHLRQQLSATQEEAAQIQSQLAALRERIAVTEREREKTEKITAEHFRNLANEIFENQTSRFKESSEQRLSELLTPFKENIEEFKKTVTTVYSNESKERYSLQNEIKNLMELNRSIGKEAQDLTRALKGDSKVQGDWGEMILERLLEMSGLQKGVHFVTQATVNADGSKIVGEDGRSLRPDVVVNYPDDRCVVIDSKVSLSAYIDYVNSPDNSDEQSEAARRHLLSVRRHIAELAEKRYQDLVGEKRLDFVMMFIPNEGAYFALMRLDPSIWEEAYAKRVLLTSPTHLIAVLKMLDQLWKQDAINKNVQEIARLSGTMVDKLVNFVSDMDNIEKHLGNAQASYTQARKRLAEGNGNVLVTARKIVNLGAKTSKASEIKRLAPDDASIEALPNE